MFKERDTKSEFILVDELLSRSDEEKFRQYARMTPDQFYYLLQQLTPVIQKQHTNFRKPISPKQRLILTLRFLATGSSQKQLSYSFRVGHTTVGLILKETCSAIWNVLGPKYVKPPTSEDWIKIAEDFEQIWNFPNCLGALDGKHIRIKSPPNSGSEFYNYKGYFSISFWHYVMLITDLYWSILEILDVTAMGVYF
uniref:uncharacterized protein LOC104265542 n=1 Tax=Ciona intestinalis TaxID=7719 RepID=UPI00089DC698|nr:uncharacterized protein LOC104265542 [Ciona intestinalis]|eukprot:XP_026695263.1 uncharacterized protein LOC104265542 [Ciona intestinalis]